MPFWGQWSPWWGWHCIPWHDSKPCPHLRPAGLVFVALWLFVGLPVWLLWLGTKGMVFGRWVCRSKLDGLHVIGRR